MAQRVLMKGNEAIAEAAIRAGLVVLWQNAVPLLPAP